MTVLVWLVIPITAVTLAIIWVAWVSRPKPPADVHDTLEDYERFRAAMEGDGQRGRRKKS